MATYRHYKNRFAKYERLRNRRIAAVNHQGICLAQQFYVVHLAPVVNHIAARFTRHANDVDPERRLPMKGDLRGVHRAAQHEYNPLQAPWRWKPWLVNALPMFQHCPPRDQPDSTKLTRPRPRAKRERAENQIAKMFVKQIVREFHQPKMASDARGDGVRLQIFRNHHLGCVYRHYRNAAPPQWLERVFRIHYC